MAPVACLRGRAAIDAVDGCGFVGGLPNQPANSLTMLSAACPLCRKEVVTDPARSDCSNCGADICRTPMGFGIDHARTLQGDLRDQGWIGPTTTDLRFALIQIGLPEPDVDALDPTLLNIDPRQSRRNFGLRHSVSLHRDTGATWVAEWPAASRLYMTRTLILVLRGHDLWWSQLSEGERVSMAVDTLMFVGKDGRAIKFGCEAERVKGPSWFSQAADLGLLMSQPAGPATTIVGEGLLRKYEEKGASMSAEVQQRASNLASTRRDMANLARFMQDTIDSETKLREVLGDLRLSGPSQLPSVTTSGLVRNVGASTRVGAAQPVQPPQPSSWSDQSPKSQSPSSRSHIDRTTDKPLGKQRQVGPLIVVFILTLFIYAHYWTYRTYEDLKQYNGTGFGGVGGVLIWFLCPFVTLFELPLEIKRMYEDDGKVSPVGVSTALWGLLLIPWWVKCQRAMNAFWASKGVPPATGV